MKLGLRWWNPTMAHFFFPFVIFPLVVDPSFGISIILFSCIGGGMWCVCALTLHVG